MNRLIKLLLLVVMTVASYGAIANNFYDGRDKRFNAIPSSFDTNSSTTFKPLDGSWLSYIRVDSFAQYLLVNAPTTTYKYDIGKPDGWYKGIYVQDIYTDSIKTNLVYGKHFIPTDHITYDLGDASHSYRRLYVDTIHGAADNTIYSFNDIRPVTNGTLYLGASSRRWCGYFNDISTAVINPYTASARVGASDNYFPYGYFTNLYGTTLTATTGTITTLSSATITTTGNVTIGGSLTLSGGLSSALTFTGGATGSYNGSTAVSIPVPYSWAQASTLSSSSLPTVGTAGTYAGFSIDSYGRVTGYTAPTVLNYAQYDASNPWSANQAFTGITFTSASYSSDRRYKTNIKDMPSVLNTIKNLRPRTYYFNHKGDKGDRIGFIAQEVEAVNDPVTNTLVKQDHKGYYSLDYGTLSTVAIKGVQELIDANTDLEKRIANLENELERCTALIKEMLVEYAKDHADESK